MEDAFTKLAAEVSEFGDRFVDYAKIRKEALDTAAATLQTQVDDLTDTISG